MGFFNFLLNTGKFFASSLRKRVGKELQGYMAPERAQKYIEKQTRIPKRAPLNVPKREFTKGDQ